MSEDFEQGLHDLYVRAALAHTRGGGLPTAAMTAAARRNRQVRTAGMAVASVAAVAVIGVGGAAALGALGHGGVTAPAGTGEPTLGATAAPTATAAPSLQDLCGADPTTLGDPGAAAITLTLTPDVLRVGENLDATLTVTGDPKAVPELAQGLRMLVVDNGSVVAVGDVLVTADQGTDGGASTEAVSGDLTTALTSCGDAPDGSVPDGEYQAYVLVPMTGEGVSPVALGGPVPFRIAASNDGTFPFAPDAQLVDGHSALFTEGAPLADGDYIGRITATDVTARTLEVDLAVFYVGQAAQDYVDAHVPGGEVMDDYYLADDTDAMTKVQLTDSASIWDSCFSDNENNSLEHYRRSLADWLAAPQWDGTGLPATQCTDGDRLNPGSLYWFLVRDGVVTDVVGQYVP